MPSRLMESIVPAASPTVFDTLVEIEKVVDCWDDVLNDDKAFVQMLIDAVWIVSIVNRNPSVVELFYFFRNLSKAHVIRQLPHDRLILMAELLAGKA